MKLGSGSHTGGHAGTGPSGAVGALQLARYAAAPNRLGYCGPGDHGRLRAHAHGGVVDRELVELLGAFDGALMHLRAIAALGCRGSVLDAKVVEAYWIGNRLLDRISREACARWLDDSLQGRGCEPLSAMGVQRALPHHNFHVLCLYPWAQLVRALGPEGAVRMMDRCRVRWGRVTGVDGRRVVVRSRPLVLGSHLRLGAPVDETVEILDGFGGPEEVTHGDWVTLHWDQLCDRLSVTQLRDLARFTAESLQLSAPRR